MIEKNTNASWLLTCPCGDGNFKVHLKLASKEEIEEVLKNLEEKGNKSKIKVLTAELNRRKKNDEH